MKEGSTANFLLFQVNWNTEHKKTLKITEVKICCLNMNWLEIEVEMFHQ